VATRERGRTRRVDPRPTKLQDRFSEQRCPALGESAWTEHPRSEPEHPELHGARHHARRTGDARQRGAVDKRSPDCVQNHVDARHLSRQRFVRQHALAVPTVTAPRECDFEHQGLTEKLQPAFDPTPSKSQIAATARSAPAPSQQLVPRCIDDGRVPARLDFEYENHVLVTAPG
jgi:hypothetical protein